MTPPVCVFLSSSLLTLCLLPVAGCYSYQTEPLFLTFSELAALEAESRQETDRVLPAAGEEQARALEVRCHEDSMEVVLKAPRFDPGLPLEPWRLRLGPVSAPPCTARPSGPGEVSIRAPLRQCGGSVVFSDAALLYSNLLLYFPPSPPGGRFQWWGAAVPLQCRYRRRFVVSGRRTKPVWSPLLSHQASFSSPKRSLGGGRFSR